jgi:hypothetical protein
MASNNQVRSRDDSRTHTMTSKNFDSSSSYPSNLAKPADRTDPAGTS